MMNLIKPPPTCSLFSTEITSIACVKKKIKTWQKRSLYLGSDLNKAHPHQNIVDCEGGEPVSLFMEPFNRFNCEFTASSGILTAEKKKNKD